MEDPSTRKVSIDIIFDRTYVDAAIRMNNHADWETIKTFLCFLGYDVKFAHVTILPSISIQAETNVIAFPARQMDRAAGWPGMSEESYIAKRAGNL